MIVPTIAGPNSIMFERAKTFAKLGYIAFVSDVYGCGEVTVMAEWQVLAAELKAEKGRFRARFHAALATFKQVDGVDDSRVAIIGYCMGGQAALELARDGADFAVAVSFHGLLETDQPAQSGAVKARILVCHGHDDPLVTPDEVSKFQSEMVAAKADWHMHIYSDTVHGFTDPRSSTRGSPVVAYNPSADRQSWNAMMSMFDELFN